MSARKAVGHHSLQPLTVQARQSRLTLSHDAILFHRNGIEFRSATPFSPWTEMTLTLQTPEDGRVHCSGVVISCTGNKHTGYHVAMVLMGMSRQAQARLSTMRLSHAP